MTNLRGFRRREIGYVFQKSNLIPFLTALENVQIVLELNGKAAGPGRRRALELLDDLGVGDRAANLPSMLSGGQQQRVAVARALANEHGAGVIVVTHDHRALDVFESLCEMEDGLIRRSKMPEIYSIE